MIFLKNPIRMRRQGDCYITKCTKRGYQSRLGILDHKVPMLARVVIFLSSGVAPL